MSDLPDDLADLLAPLQWTQREDGFHHADGASGRHYVIALTPGGDDEPPSWMAMTANREPLRVRQLEDAKRVCWLWEQTFVLADLCMLRGDFEAAERLRTEPDEY